MTKSKLLTRRQLADARGVHMQTITKWERDGMPVAKRGARGRPSLYDPGAVDAWCQAKEQAARTGGAVSLEQARTRKEEAQARLAEQAHAMREQRLLPIADVERAWSGHVAAVRTKLLALPVTLADKLHRVATLDGVAGVEHALNEVVRDVLRELAGEGVSA